MQIDIEDSIGIIQKVANNGKMLWELHEGEVVSITYNRYSGRRVKARGFYTFDDDAITDIENNTAWMKESPALTLVNEPFILTDELRQRANRWIETQNARGDDDA